VVFVGFLIFVVCVICRAVVCMYVCMYVCIYIYIIHTYIRTYIHRYMHHTAHIFILITRTTGHAVAQFIEEMCYKSEGHEFDVRQGH